MPAFGYALSSEEHRPMDLVRNAKMAEDAGFTFALISDHFHPWVDKQGESPFVWAVIGGIAHATETLRLGTGVTCPTIRIHPAILAQAAATAADMMPGRFFFGVGTGENLNEHVLADRWPAYDLRNDMLEEAIDVIRMLWTGETITYYGDHYDVEEARIYTLPDELPPIYIAASGENSAEMARQIGDGLITTAPSKEVLNAFRQGDGADKPMYGKLTVCWAEDYDDALDTAYDYWAFTALPGELSQELPTPTHFEQAIELVTREHLAEKLTIGPDAQAHLDAIQTYVDAGFTHIYIHQIGPDQAGFIDFYQNAILPELSS